MSASVHTTTRPLACWVPIRRAVPAPGLRGSTMVRIPAVAVGGAVIHTDQLKGQPGTLQGRPDPLELQLDMVPLVETRQHHTDVKARGGHFRRVPVRFSRGSR